MDETNQYVLDAESEAELARLMRQDQLLTRGMGGVFPEKPDLTTVQSVLDLACGPGGWALEVAFQYTDMEIIGVDLSPRMVTYANARAKVQHCSQVRFQVANILQPLPFPAASFDLVNARLIAAVLRREQWPPLLAECQRLLRPGGLLRVTEMEWGMANKPSFEEACHTIHLAMSRLGYTCSPTGFHFGIMHVLPSLFRQSGLQQIGHLPQIIEYSFGAEAHESVFLDYACAFPAVEPLLVRAQVTTSEAWQDLFPKALAEMHEEDFCALWILLTVWGRKPAAEGESGRSCKSK